MKNLAWAKDLAKEAKALGIHAERMSIHPFGIEPVEKVDPKTVLVLSKKLRGGWPTSLSLIVVIEEQGSSSEYPYSLIDGHHRLAAAMSIGLEDVPVLVLPGITRDFMADHDIPRIDLIEILSIYDKEIKLNLSKGAGGAPKDRSANVYDTFESLADSLDCLANLLETSEMSSEIKKWLSQSKIKRIVFNAGRKPLYTTAPGMTYFSNEPLPKAFGRYVTRAYINIKNPFSPENEAEDIVCEFSDKEAEEILRSTHLYDEDEEIDDPREEMLRQMEEDSIFWQEPRIIAKIKELDYDGVIGRDSFGGRMEYVVFDRSKQVHVIDRSIA